MLLLESKALLGRELYSKVISDVVDAYWKDYGDHRDDFRPAFLMNDIVRLWKTLCVNYEANTKRQPERERAKRKLQNYKLKNSRVVTCYSALLYLMQVFSEQRSVHKADAQCMASLSPTERLEWLAKRSDSRHAGTVSELLEHYEEFLDSTNKAKQDLITELLDEEQSRKFAAGANKVGDGVAKLVQTFADNPLFRYLIV